VKGLAAVSIADRIGIIIYLLIALLWKAYILDYFKMVPNPISIIIIVPSVSNWHP
jgi:hypothetical protein